MSEFETSRRGFLKGTAVAAATAGLTGAIQSGAFAGGDDTLRIGLIGCGGRGKGAANDALQSEHNVKLVAVGDVFEDRAQDAATSIQASLGDKGSRVAVDRDKIFSGFDAYQKVLEAGVNVVILATPPGFRPIHFEAAVKAGVHVFMEKPVAVDAPGVRQVLAAAKIADEKGLKVGVGLQRRHEAKYMETVAKLKDGAIGDMVLLRAYWNGGGVWEPPLSRENAKSEMEYQLRNWYYYNWLCGDHIVEQHIHNLDVCNWVMGGPPVRANGMGGRQVRVDKRYGEIYDHHFLEYEYASGARMLSQCRHQPNCWNSVSEHAHGTKGQSDISGGRISGGADGDWRFRGQNPNPYQVEHYDLQTAIKNGSAYNEAEYGAHSTMTSILGRMATYSGKIVEWDEAINSEISLMPKEFSWDAAPPVAPDENGVYPVAMPGVTQVL